MKPSKVEIGVETADILGRRWNKGTLTPCAHKLNPLTTCKEPRTIKGLRSFLGAMRICKDMLPGLDVISQPLDNAVPSTLSGSSTVEWTTEMREAFSKCQEIMKVPKAIVVPKPSDCLIQVSDGALKYPAIGIVLLVKREGVKNLMPAGYYSLRIKGSLKGWSACDLEALAHAKGAAHNDHYLREFKNPITLLTDNKPVVDCGKKLQRGEFSSSPRVQTFVTMLQKYNFKLFHISAKLTSPLI